MKDDSQAMITVTGIPQSQQYNSIVERYIIQANNDFRRLMANVSKVTPQ